MVSMIERVAGAIRKALHDDNFYANWSMDREERVSLDGDFDPTALARAAIAAMREPTEEMIASFFSTPGLGDVDAVDPVGTWNAMIEEALK